MHLSQAKRRAQRPVRIVLAGMKAHIVALGLLTRDDLTALGPAFDRAWPIDEAPCFEGLLLAIDEADRAVWRERDRPESRPKPDDA